MQRFARNVAGTRRTLRQMDLRDALAQRKTRAQRLTAALNRSAQPQRLTPALNPSA
jgi:hypothetical protein